MIIIISSALILVLAIILLSGRGSFLVAGFNTLPKDIKDTYDKKALSKFFGKILLPIAFLTFLLLIEDIFSWYVWAYTVIVLGICLFAIIYSRTGGRFRKPI